ncbi:MAG: TRAM domain-containing protein, partial [Deltaproteobacteria bacterium]|nr:TRAM domain-containing protein [Deltaproteobacteria bacterium]
SDFIVGFPGEKEEDFEQTLAVMEEVRYDSAFSFRFSPRPGTRAASMPDAVPSAEAGRRLRRLQSLQDGHTRERLDACIGKEFEVLVEGRSARDEAQHFGRTPCYKAVNFTAEETGTGPFRRVRIRAAGSHSLSGVEGDHRD